MMSTSPIPGQSLRIAVLIACHNRRDKTLACLEAIHAQEGLDPQPSLEVVLVDDGSTDGTSAAVRNRFPRVKLIEGNGQLYWNRGMRTAFEHGAVTDPDYYLWLNDDTRLFATALRTLLSARPASDEGHIIVGSTLERPGGSASYGGVVRTSRLHPFRFRLVEPADRPVPCDTMNGNCVLISREAARKVGNLDPVYQQGFGDYDYGLRARGLGCSLWVAPGAVGCCPRTKVRQDWRNASLSRRERWKAVTSPKGLPPRQLLHFSLRHGGVAWPIFLPVPYLRALFWPTRTPPSDTRATVGSAESPEQADSKAHA